MEQHRPLEGTFANRLVINPNKSTVILVGTDKTFGVLQ